MTGTDEPFELSDTNRTEIGSGTVKHELAAAGCAAHRKAALVKPLYDAIGGDLVQDTRQLRVHGHHLQARRPFKHEAARIISTNFQYILIPYK